MWFDSWAALVRVLLVGTAAYLTLVVILRLSGKRTLAKLNAFDFVVTVALGSTLATIVLSADVSWSEGAVALGALAVLQLLVAWATSRVPGIRSVVTASPTCLVLDGRVDPAAVRAQRVTVAELRQAVRASGMADLAAVGAVVLETDGSLSVVPTEKLGDGWALADVEGAGGVRRES